MSPEHLIWLVIAGAIALVALVILRAHAPTRDEPSDRSTARVALSAEELAAVERALDQIDKNSARAQAGGDASPTRRETFKSSDRDRHFRWR